MLDEVCGACDVGQKDGYPSMKGTVLLIGDPSIENEMSVRAMCRSFLCGSHSELVILFSAFKMKQLLIGAQQSQEYFVLLNHLTKTNIFYDRLVE